jgi:hypothetical protein
MRLACLFLAVSMVSASPALGAQYHMKEATAGCVTQDGLDHLSRIAKDGDIVAFTKMESSGFCRHFSKGTHVFVEQNPSDYPIECVRPEGGVSCFWVMKRFVIAQ